MSAAVFAETVKVASLRESDLDEMFSLLDRYYENVTREVFRRDLFRKSEVILIRDHEQRRIQGFSTLQFFQVEHEGRPVRAVFSGDTIIDERFWGQTALHRAFVARLLREKIRRPFSPLYWFLISKGYKTYLLMANNFVRYYPALEGYGGGDGERDELRSLTSVLATTLFGDSYDDRSGVIRFCGHDAARLRDHVAPITTAELGRSAKIGFFTQMNPGWSQGDELACVGDLNAAMIFRFVQKSLLKAIGLYRSPAKEEIRSCGVEAQTP